MSVDDKFRGQKISDCLKADDELERDARRLDRALGEVMRQVFDPTNPANCSIWNEAGAVACALDGIKLEKPEGWGDSWLDKSTLDELFELAEQWHIFSFTAEQIIGKCQNKRLGLTEESES